jgi:hypothetical protein
MSKSKTNVKNSLFKLDPVSIKDNKTSARNNTVLFIKGNKDVTFELKKGYDNVYIIKTSDTKWEFNRNDLLEALKSLKKHYYTSIKTLGEEQQESFGKVMAALDMLHKTGKLYELIHNDIQHIFADVKIVIPGTVAAYFIGCSSNDNFSGPMGCNPKCAASLAPGGKDPSNYTCGDLVLMYENDRTFSSLNQKMSPHCYIYIGDFRFKGFSRENIQQLTDANISSVTLIYGKEDGTYGDVISSMPVNQLPLVTDTSTDATSDDNGAWILFVVIIAIIILILLLILYQSYNRRTQL